MSPKLPLFLVIFFFSHGINVHIITCHESIIHVDNTKENLEQTFNNKISKQNFKDTYIGEFTNSRLKFNIQFGRHM